MRILSVSFLCLLVGQIAWSPLLAEDADRPQQKFQITEETTYLTEPVDQYGFVDYIGYLNQKHSEGVTPENNAAVLFWQATGLTEDVQSYRHVKEKLIEELGTDPFSGDSGLLVPLQSIIDAGSNFSLEQAEAEGKIALEKEWTSEDCPIYKQWLEANTDFLKLISAGARREKYYQPLISRHSPGGLQTTFPLGVSKLHGETLQLLKARALLSLGEKQPQESIRDLMTLHRIGRYLQQMTYSPAITRGSRIEREVYPVDQRLISAIFVSDDDLIEYYQALLNLPELATIADHNEFARIDALDRLQRISFQPVHFIWFHWNVLASLGTLYDNDDPEAAVIPILRSMVDAGVDWDEVLRHTNGIFDEIDKLRNLERYEKKFIRMRELEFILKLERKKSVSEEYLEGIENLTIKERSKNFAYLFYAACVGVNPYSVKFDAEKITRERLTEIALIRRLLPKLKRENSPETNEIRELMMKRHRPPLLIDPFSGETFKIGDIKGGEIYFSIGHDRALNVLGQKKINEELIFEFRPWE